jgi:hypothetical protein
LGHFWGIEKGGDEQSGRFSFFLHFIILVWSFAPSLNSDFKNQGSLIFAKTVTPHFWSSRHQKGGVTIP